MDLNLHLAAYKAAALPIKLHRHFFIVGASHVIRTRTNRLEACHAAVTLHSLPFMEHCTGQWHAKIRHGVCTVAKVNLIFGPHDSVDAVGILRRKTLPKLLKSIRHYWAFS